MSGYLGYIFTHETCLDMQTSINWEIEKLSSHLRMQTYQHTSYKWYTRQIEITEVICLIHVSSTCSKWHTSQLGMYTVYENLIWFLDIKTYSYLKFSYHIHYIDLVLNGWFIALLCIIKVLVLHRELNSRIDQNEYKWNVEIILESKNP